MASVQRQQQAPYRAMFTDSSGTMWTVEERERPGFSFRLERTLVFISTSAFRCVRRYPSNWFALTPDALEKLSWGS